MIGRRTGWREIETIGRARLAAAASLACCFAAGTHGQTVLGIGGNASSRLFSNDRAVLEAGDPRKDLPCTVIHEKPVLGFDLKFHASFDVTVPMRDLAGQENLLTILFRVTPEGKEPSYFIQRIRVPSIEEDSKGDAFLQGSFDLGEGKYHVDWLIRDRAERVCSSYWDLEATLPAKDKGMTLHAPAAMVQAAEIEFFRDEPPVERNPDAGLNVKVVVNFAPQNSRSAALQPVDTSALVSILRTISRDPRIAKFSIVAFNMQERRVLYRKPGCDRIDFPAIGQAVQSLKLGTVDLGKLADKHGDTSFLEGLLQKELRPDDSTSHDAVIFAGPKAMLDDNVPAEALRAMGELPYPVFYMNYNLWPQQVPWRDSISHAVKHFRGVEYTITRPRDLWYAVSEMVSRVEKSRLARRVSLSGGQE